MSITLPRTIIEREKIEMYLVKEITMHIRNTLIRPPPMNEKKLGKEPELSKGVVGGHGSL